MATKKNQQDKPLTRAEKREAAKDIVRELLNKNAYKAGELIDEASRIFTERFAGEETENANDVKGRIGSILDVMKKENEVQFDGGTYAAKAEEKPALATAAETVAEVKTEEKPKRTRAKKTTAKAEEKELKAEETTTDKTEEKPVKAKRASKKKTSEPLPAAPLQPIAPVAPVTPEVAPEPIPEKEEKAEEKPAPKKRTRAKKAVKTETEEIKAPAETEVKAEEAKAEAPAQAIAPVAETKAEERKDEPKKEEVKKDEPKHALVDMSFLFGDIKPAKKEAPKTASPVERTAEKAEKPAPIKAEAKPQPKAEEKTEAKPAPAAVRPAQKQERKQEQKQPEAPKAQTRSGRGRGAKPARTLTPDEKLQEAFLARLHKLGGEYFEYYSVYLLERYSRMNGRRLEALKITGGDHDGGIDGELELTDRLGFRETIYIQAKNWDPDKGDEKLWVVGETLLQQFIGACVCRQAKDGKQHCRGMFITTSRFTPEAKRLLDDTSDKFVGYDGADLYETAKECGFGIVKKNGEYALDDALLSSTKAFFNNF